MNPTRVRDNATPKTPDQITSETIGNYLSVLEAHPDGPQGGQQSFGRLFPCDRRSPRTPRLPQPYVRELSSAAPSQASCQISDNSATFFMLARRARTMRSRTHNSWSG